MGFIQKIINKLSSKFNSFNAISGKVIIDKSAYVKGSKLQGKISIQEGAKIHQSFIVGDVEIGKYSSLWGPNIDIYSALNKVSIGNFCSIARNTSFQEYLHNASDFTTYNYHKNLLGDKSAKMDLVSKGPIVIDHDVWIGAHCVILGGAHISTGAIIAANSVVTGFVPPYAIVAGSPAKVIKYRFEASVIEQLLCTKWWAWDVEKIKNEYKTLQKIVGNE